MFLSAKSSLLGFFFVSQVLTDATYDYVVVGGGTAGLAIAGRLSEDTSASVAVVEAGTYYEISDPLVASTPGADFLYIGADPDDTNSLVDWDFVTAPQAGANNRTLHYARGKCLGGSSARNFMIYQRADRGSLQQWADAVDDQSYTFDNMLPYYQQSCSFTAPGSTRFANATPEYNETAFSPTGGPLQISFPNYGQAFSTYAGPAFDEIGVSPAEDFNSGDLFGAQFCTTTIDSKTAVRSTSETSFLDQARLRTNLHVYSLTMAKKILFNDNKTATGVVTDLAGTLTATKEVILSAGAFHSPQLLMVSGIGPASTLNALNIPVIADLPGVGQNMTDHIFFGPTYKINVETIGLSTSLTEGLSELQSLTGYLNAEGLLTSNNCDFLAFEKAPTDLITTDAAAVLSKLPASWPDLEYLNVPGYIGNFQNLITQAAENSGHYATILAALVAPQSRGTVTITSSDTSDLPVINPNWLTDPTDISVAIAGYKRARAAWTSNAMKPVLANTTEFYPGPSVQTDDEILEVIRDSLMTVWHAATTCRMGVSGDPSAVVDSKARVFGVNGLRVVDASSMALLPPGHPQSFLYAFAEKIADGIKKGD